MASESVIMSRTEVKRRSILSAAEVLFLRHGYLGTSMDELAEHSGVSKQTVYKQFSSKKELFVELVSSMTAGAGDGLEALEVPSSSSELRPYFQRYGMNELTIILTPRLLQLRRLVIGEVGRFPDLANALYVNGPQRAIQAMADVLAELHRQGLLEVSDSVRAATTLNWLLVAAPVNEAMLLGDEVIPSQAELESHVAEAVRVFLAAHSP